MANAVETSMGHQALIRSSSPGSCTPTNQRSFSRVHLWTHLFVTKHQNPFQKREYQGADQDAVSDGWYRGLILMSQWWTSTLTLKFETPEHDVEIHVHDISACM